MPNCLVSYRKKQYRKEKELMCDKLCNYKQTDNSLYLKKLELKSKFEKNEKLQAKVQDEFIKVYHTFKKKPHRQISITLLDIDNDKMKLFLSYSRCGKIYLYLYVPPGCKHLLKKINELTIYNGESQKRISELTDSNILFQKKIFELGKINVDYEKNLITLTNLNIKIEEQLLKTTQELLFLEGANSISQEQSNELYAQLLESQNLLAELDDFKSSAEQRISELLLFIDKVQKGMHYIGKGEETSVSCSRLDFISL